MIKHNKSMNDGVKTNRSIRDIPMMSNGSKRRSTSSVKKNKIDGDMQDNILPSQRTDKSKYVLWGITFVSVIVLVFAMSSLFSGATITIAPKQQRITLNDMFTTVADNSDEGIFFQVKQISDTASKTVESDSEEFVEEQASGKIVIYNNQSGSSQRLIAKTRFQATNGRVYRIQKAVTVPGQTTIDGKKVPGQLEVTVYADKNGAEYNQGLTDFTIPGFENDPRFKTIYARSKTAISGGFSGSKPVVNKDTEDRVAKELQDILKERLFEDLQSRISDNFIIPEDGVFYTFEILPSTKNEEGKTEMIYKGTVQAMALTATDVTKAILQKTSGNSDSNVYISNINDLQISLLSAAEFDIQNATNANIDITGNAFLIWNIDEEKIKKDLAGFKKKTLSEKLSSYPEITKASAVLRPFWNRTFPTDLEKMRVKIDLKD